MGISKYFNTVVRMGDRRGWIVGYGDNGESSNTVQVAWDADPVTDAEVEDEWVNIDDLEVDYKDSWEFQVERAEKLEVEIQKARMEAQICRECFSDLKDLCIALGYQIVPYLQAFQPLKAKMEDVEGIRDEIRKRLKAVVGRPRPKRKTKEE